MATTTCRVSGDQAGSAFRRALATDSAVPWTAAIPKTEPHTAARVRWCPGRPKSIPRNPQAATPATASRPDPTIETPERWEYSVARSMSARMRSSSRDASRRAEGSSLNFVTQSTLQQGCPGVKGAGLFLGARSLRPAVPKDVDRAGHRAGEAPRGRQVRHRLLVEAKLVLDLTPEHVDEPGDRSAGGDFDRLLRVAQGVREVLGMDPDDGAQVAGFQGGRLQFQGRAQILLGRPPVAELAMDAGVEEVE